MRHLREIYWPNAFSDILDGQHGPLTRNQVKFGMDTPSVHIHVLRGDINSGDINNDQYVELTWQTFRFGRPRIANEQLTTVPLTGSEFIVVLNGSVVQPLTCS